MSELYKDHLAANFLYLTVNLRMDQTKISGKKIPQKTWFRFFTDIFLILISSLMDLCITSIIFWPKTILVPNLFKLNHV